MKPDVMFRNTNEAMNRRLDDERSDDFRLAEQAAYVDACVIRGITALAHLSKHPGTMGALFDRARADEQTLNALAMRIQELPSVLSYHWLSGMECDHEARTDVATCACGRWRSAAQPSVGAAVQRWVEHVLAELSSAGEVTT